MTDDLPIACDLSDPTQRDRERAIRELLTTSAADIADRGDGLRIRFAGTSPPLAEIAELIALERTCCRFLRFELIAAPGEGPVELRITGPAGTREFLRSWYE